VGFGGIGGLLFDLSQASEGRLVDRLPVRGGGMVRVRDRTDGELLRLAVGHVAAWTGEEPARTGDTVERRGAGARGAAR
jgi:hypothetical protein